MFTTKITKEHFPPLEIVSQFAEAVIPDESAYGGRDPVSNKVLLFLDSGQSLRDFRNDRRGAHTTNIESFSTLLEIIALGILNGERTDKLGFLN